MPMLDPAMFDPATYMSPGMLAQMFGGGQAAPALPLPVDVQPPPGGIPPGPMSNGDGGALMPVPHPPPATPDMAALSGAYGSDRPPPKTDVPETSLLGRIGGKIDDFLKNNRSTLMALGAGMAGSQSLGQGLGRGMQLALPAQQQDIAQQKQNQTVSALIKRGLPPDVAQAAVNNPAILQQLLPQLFGTKQRKFTQIGEDFTGAKQFGFVDEVSGKTYDLQGKELGGQGGGGSSSIPMGSDGLPIQGDALMKHLEKTDPVAAAGIKGLISGDINAAGRNMQKLAPLAKLVDPSFDATQYPVRLATRKSYTSGKDFQESQALNTVSGHMARLMDAAEGLGNTGFKPWNWLKNATADMIGGSPALVKFRNDLVTTQNELAKAYHGGHVSDSAFAAFNKSINEAQTPAEMKAAIGELADLLHSKIEAKESGYRSSMGPTPLPEEYRATNQHAREAFSKIGDWSRGMPAAGGAPAGAAAAASPAAAAAPITATNPKTGVKVRLEGDRWVPVQ